MPYGKTLVDTIESSGNLSITGNVAIIGNLSSNNHVFNTVSLSTASAGTLEYDGGELYFTPLGTQRGLVPSAQYYRLNSAVVGSNAIGAQSAFGVGVTLSSSTVYHFRAVINLIKTAGTTSHTVSTLFGGTATFNNIVYNISGADGNGTWGTGGSGGANRGSAFNAATAALASGTLSAATQVVWIVLDGTMSINAGGTLIPQYSLSAAPGGAYSTQIGSYFLIYPIGGSGSNISIGTWA